MITRESNIFDEDKREAIPDPFGEYEDIRPFSGPGPEGNGPFDISFLADELPKGLGLVDLIDEINRRLRLDTIVEYEAWLWVMHHDWNPLVARDEMQRRTLGREDCDRDPVLSRVSARVDQIAADAGPLFIADHPLAETIRSLEGHDGEAILNDLT